MPPIVLDGTTGITTPGLTNTGTETLVNLTTTGNTTLGDASTDTLNVGNGGLVKDASGNVGIGTASPALKLDVNGSIKMSGGTGTALTWDTAIGSQYLKYDSTFNGLILAGYSGVGFRVSGATSNNMTLDASGNLGLGVTTVLGRAQFNVSDTSTTILNNPALYLSNTGTATTNQRVDLGFRWQDGTYNGSSSISAIRESGTSRLTAIAFCPANSSGDATERARIDSSGNLLVGTLSPSATYGKLTVAGGISITPDSSSKLQIGRYSAGAPYSYIKMGSTSSGLKFTDPADSVDLMTLDSSGNLLVGDTSAVGKIYSFVNSSTLPAIHARQDGTANIQNWVIAGGATRAYILTNGGLGNFSANNVNLSDERMKTDISLAGNYLAKICAIPVKTFKYKDQTDDELNLGVIAQDVEAVAPELVDVSGWGAEVDQPEDGVPLKAVYQTDLQYALMKCIQEQQAIIQSLTDRITALENK